MNKSAGVVAGGTRSSSLAHGGASAGVQVGAPYTGQGTPRSRLAYSRLRGRAQTLCRARLRPTPTGFVSSLQKLVQECCLSPSRTSCSPGKPRAVFSCTISSEGVTGKGSIALFLFLEGSKGNLKESRHAEVLVREENDGSVW